MDSGQQCGSGLTILQVLLYHVAVSTQLVTCNNLSWFDKCFNAYLVSSSTEKQHKLFWVVTESSGMPDEGILCLTSPEHVTLTSTLSPLECCP